MSEKRRIIGNTVGTPLNPKMIEDKIPKRLRDLEAEAGFRTVTDNEKAMWNAKVDSVNGKKGAAVLSASDVGADPKGTADSLVSTHNTNTNAHNDICLLIAELGERLNAVANSTDIDLDQLSELVAYIKSNRSLIENVTTNKVNYSDIINNLTTNVSNKPLSAAQGVALKSLLDNLDALVGKFSGYGGATSIAEYIAVVKNDLDEYVNFFMEQIVELDNNKLNTTELPTAIEDALSTAKSSGEFDGKDGADGKDGTDGVGILGITQIVSSNESSGTNVISVGLTDGTVHNFTVKNGKKGSDGKSAYKYAQDGGFTGTEEEFASLLASGGGSGRGDSVQSDWSQNDETAPDYVKGRTHWSEYAETALIDNVSGTFADVTAPTYPCSLNAGQTYTIIYNGVTYERIAVNFEFNGMATVSLGNTSALGGDDTGEPFLIIYTETMGGTSVIDLSGEENITLSLITNNETVHKLPRKYIPSDVYFANIYYVEGVFYSAESFENIKEAFNSNCFIAAKVLFVQTGSYTTFFLSAFNAVEKTCSFSGFMLEAVKTLNMSWDESGQCIIEMA